MSLSNKEIVRLLYQEVIGKANLELANQYIAEDYIQHNPMIPSGRAGVLAAIAYLQQMPRETPHESPIKRMIAEEDYVVVHMNVNFAGQHQVVMDIFRLANGQLVEHWDAIESVSIESVDERMSGPHQIEDLGSTQANKAIIRTHYQTKIGLGLYDNVHRIIGEGNFVLAQASATVEGRLQVNYELFCLADGEIAKSWEVSQFVPDKMAHDNGMI
ncbi:MAG: nuclear transport factor 2 family protein [Bacteroidia bacterium]